MSNNKFKNFFKLGLEEIEKLIEKEFYSKKTEYHPLLFEAMEYSLFSGGKRVRPILVKWVSELGNPDPLKLSKAAAAIEYLHTYSLIHDDLPAMDDDSERRGKPSSHIVYGEAVAILAGDGLLTEAFRLLGEAGDARLAEILGRDAGAGGMVGGQVADILREEEIEDINELKTARLFRAGSLLGGIVGDFDDNSLDKISLYGINLGKAFQLKDDILDEETEDAKKTLDQARKYVDEALKALEEVRFNGCKSKEKLESLACFMISRDK
ncbi:MAG: polyprenyl synthetase family protein [Elusimicrobia bacterium]|nr:polyprenyl synthetase family protein [Elusimicrobiota bacterium]